VSGVRCPVSGVSVGAAVGAGMPQTILA
jgi:hypothetical protein